MNRDINTDFRGDIIKLMYTYVKFLGRFENENIKDIDNQFIQSVEDNTYHNSEHEKLILDIARDMLLNQDNNNGITLDDDTVIDGVCRVKTNDDIVKDIDHNNATNMISIVGGKLTTYRKMAEETTDYICDYYNFNIDCSTDIKELPYLNNESKIDEIVDKYGGYNDTDYNINN